MGYFYRSATATYLKKAATHVMVRHGLRVTAHVSAAIAGTMREYRCPSGFMVASTAEEFRRHWRLIALEQRGWQDLPGRELACSVATEPTADYS